MHKMIGIGFLCLSSFWTGWTHSTARAQDQSTATEPTAEAGASQNEAQSLEALGQVRDTLQDALHRAAKDGMVVLRSDQSAESAENQNEYYSNQKLRSASNETLSGTNSCLYPDAYMFVESAKEEVYFPDTPLNPVMPLEEIAQLQAALSLEQGGYDRKVGEELVRAYLMLGFGDEARSVATLFRDEEMLLLTEMAEIVAENPLPDDAKLVAGFGCGGPEMPWRIMTLLDQNPEAALNLARSNMTEFSHLPDYLAEIFTTRLALQALDRKDFALSRQLTKSAAARTDHLSLRLRFLQTLFEAREGYSDAITGLIAFAREENEMRARALFALGDIHEQGKKSLYPHYVQDIQSVSDRHKKQGTGETALFYEMRALVILGQYDKALQMARRETSLAPMTRKNIITVVAAQLSSDLISTQTAKRRHAFTTFIRFQSDFKVSTSDYVSLMRQAVGVAQTLDLPRTVLTLSQNIERKDWTKDTQYANAWAYLELKNPKKALDTAMPRASEGRFLEITIAALQSLGLQSEAVSFLKKMPVTAERLEIQAKFGWAFDWDAAADALEILATESQSSKDVIKRNMAHYMTNENLTDDQLMDSDLFGKEVTSGADESGIVNLLDQTEKELEAMRGLLAPDQHNG